MTIRTGHDAVSAAGLYLTWLGFRDVGRPGAGPASGIDLQATASSPRSTPAPARPRCARSRPSGSTRVGTSAAGVFFSSRGTPRRPGPRGRCRSPALRDRPDRDPAAGEQPCRRTGEHGRLNEPGRARAAGSGHPRTGPPPARHTECMRIRSARRSDLPLLQEIERAAGEPFRAPGHGLRGRRRSAPARPAGELPAGRLLLGGHRPLSTTGDRPLGYVLADPVDDALHIEQVSVDPTAARRGIGRDLIAHLCRPGSAAGHDGAHPDHLHRRAVERPVLHADRLPVLTEHELTDGLRAIRAEEAQHGLDRWPPGLHATRTVAGPRPSPVPKPAKTPPVPDTSGPLGLPDRGCQWWPLNCAHGFTP